MARFVLPLQTVIDANGRPLAGAKLYFYEEGTSTPKDTYSDKAMSVPNTNPVVASQAGVFGDIYLDGTYRVELKDSADVTQPGYPADGVGSAGEGSLLTKNVAGGVDVTLTAGEAGSSNYRFTGLLTANINVIVPDSVHNFTADNGTTGAFTLTVKTSAGAGVQVIQGETLALYCDATDVLERNDAKVDKSKNNTLSGDNTFSGSVNLNGITKMGESFNTAYATVASAATTSAIWAAAGNVIDFTGTATITDFPAAPQAGAQRTLICAGACTFTDGGNITVLGGTQTVSAGDIAIVTAITTTTFNIYLVNTNGALVPLSFADASTSATVDFTGLDGTYDHYILFFKDIVAQTDNVSLRLQLGTGATPTYQTANYIYHLDNTNSATYTASSGASSANIVLTQNHSNNGAYGMSGNLMISGLISNTHKKVRSELTYMNNAAVITKAKCDATWTGGSTTDITALRFLFTSGNITSGRFALYGVKNV